MQIPGGYWLILAVNSEGHALRGLTPCPPLRDRRGGTIHNRLCQYGPPIRANPSQESPLSGHGEGIGGEASKGVPSIISNQTEPPALPGYSI
jgi:hypothetical protein